MLMTKQKHCFPQQITIMFCLLLLYPGALECSGDVPIGVNTFDPVTPENVWIQFSRYLCSCVKITYVKNIPHQEEHNLMSSNVFFCPEPRDTQFTVYSKEKKQIVTSENLKTYNICFSLLDCFSSDLFT